MGGQGLRDEALLILQGEGAILRTAREVLQLMRGAGVDSALIGGLAVVLHGHVRTTLDVDLYVHDRPDEAATVLKANG